MQWVRPDDAGYDEARTLFNAMIDRRPAVIAQCTDAADVREALAMARKHGLEVAVRSGGHSVAGMSMIDGGLVVDVRPMKRISFDAESRTATVGGGVTWGEFDRAGQELGLATTGGRVTTTGVSGFTLGGGSGWLDRAWGLACDNLVSVDLVTASGNEVTASATENPELFWALHGGGGNFGVATSFTFNLHDVGPEVFCGLLLWPADAARDAALAFRDYVHSSPEALGANLVGVIAPPEDFVPAQMHGKPALAMVIVHAGSVEEGREAVRPLQELAPAADILAPRPYAEFQGMLDDEPGQFNYWSADYHDQFPDEAVDVFLDYGKTLPHESSQLLLAPWGGAAARVDPASTPMARRTSRWVSHPFALWRDPAQTEEAIGWARGFRRDIAAFTSGGVYLNFIGHEGQDRIKAAFGAENYARLARLKGEYDPENVFRGNQNIQPATAEPAAP
ncbi:oxidoreductase, FAD-binding protein [Arthrobacter crystallopoietes BAB-32]|uniref:Oxidoreductase, FAD-binding protein n=1 Tax=Arthrobacter crystallopoietes BAB-32 TaxID=1246476 RepID=N1UZ51_9MICC|nr:FAD-binding oxidoreductase [Arthrobacter crystallopoietes]EMY33074.1 oxidoreductase, FAD-binding protein [Arthrobacter crystallopoietes BAB-32]